MEAGRLFSIMADFRKRRHLEFLIWLLIGFNLWRPSWIWETIEPIVLETIAYSLSRLLIGYRRYEPCILLRPLYLENSAVLIAWLPQLHLCSHVFTKVLYGLTHLHPR